MRFIKIILSIFKRKDKTKSLNEGNLQYTENKENFKESLKTEKQKYEIPEKESGECGHGLQNYV